MSHDRENGLRCGPFSLIVRRITLMRQDCMMANRPQTAIATIARQDALRLRLIAAALLLLPALLLLLTSP